jgi:hypothetical protein
MNNDEFQGQGGSFVMRDGKRVRVEAPTQPTDTGGARDADGKPLDAPQEPAAAETTTTRPGRSKAAAATE